MQTLLYSNHRENIETGDLFFTASQSIISKAIKFFTRSKVSHAGLFVWTEWAGKKRLMTVEYTLDGFQTRFASDYIADCYKDNEEFYFGKLPEAFIPQKYKIQHNIAKNSDGQYDTTGALLSLFRPSHGKNFYCSEFVAEVLLLEKNTGRGGFTPDDLANLCVFFKKIV